MYFLNSKNFVISSVICPSTRPRYGYIHITHCLLYRIVERNIVKEKNICLFFDCYSQWVISETLMIKIFQSLIKTNLPKHEQSTVQTKFFKWKSTWPQNVQKYWSWNKINKCRSKESCTMLDIQNSFEKKQKKKINKINHSHHWPENSTKTKLRG